LPFQLDSFDPAKFLELAERARAAEENLEKAKEEVARLTRLTKEYAPTRAAAHRVSSVASGSLPQMFTAAWCCRYERAEKAAEEDKKEDPTLLRQPLYCCFAVCNPQQ
jgi:hypothetical protein